MEETKKSIQKSKYLGFVGALCLVVGFVVYFLLVDYRNYSYIPLVFGFIIIAIALVLKYIETRKKL